MPDRSDEKGGRGLTGGLFRGGPCGEPSISEPVIEYQDKVKALEPFVPKYEQMADEIIKTNLNLVEKVLGEAWIADIGDPPKTTLSYLQAVNQICRFRKDAEETGTKKSPIRDLLLIETSFLVKCLNSYLYHFPLPQKNLISGTFNLGMTCERLRSLSQRGPDLYTSLKDIMHSIKSTEGRQGGWQARQTRMEEVLEIADRLWTDGDERLHHEMARYLHDNHCQDLPVTSLRRELKPIAKKHDRVFGIKGIKKKKS